jgi:hypothetical protein
MTLMAAPSSSCSSIWNGSVASRSDEPSWNCGLNNALNTDEARLRTLEETIR